MVEPFHLSVSSGQSQMPVKRKVHFFRVYVFEGEDGTPPDFDIVDALDQVEELKFFKKSTAKNSRYAQTKQGLLCLWPKVARNKQNEVTSKRLQLGKIRRRDLPRVDSGGKPVPLPIAVDEGLVELTHMQFFSRGIVGAEFNYYGPRASALPVYFEEKLPTLPHFRLHPILNRNAREHLDELEDIRLASIKLKPSNGQLLKSASKSIEDAFEQLEGISDAGSIILTLKAEPYKKMDNKLIGALKSILGASSNPREDFEDFDVRGRSSSSGRVETFDILKDRFVFEHEIERISERSRGVDSTSMFNAIEESYNLHKEELEQSLAGALE